MVCWESVPTAADTPRPSAAGVRGSGVRRWAVAGAGESLIVGPVVGAEVVSLPMAVAGRGRRLPDGREIPSVRGILPVSSTGPRFRAPRRTADGWRGQELRDEGAVHLQPLGVTIDLRSM